MNRTAVAKELLAVAKCLVAVDDALDEKTPRQQAHTIDRAIGGLAGNRRVVLHKLDGSTQSVSGAIVKGGWLYVMADGDLRVIGTGEKITDESGKVIAIGRRLKY